MNSKTLQFYRDRADEALRQAEAATLSHVRDRCRRSAGAWTLLADRIAETERQREETLSAKDADKR